MSAPVELDHASFAYESRTVLRDVSLTLERGELLGVLGPNGAGKSTLIRLMAGLARPSAGRVKLAGDEASGLSRTEAARRVALVPQNEPSAFGFTVREVVAMGRAPHTGLLGGLSARDREAVDRALVRCDALALADRRVGALSGGEQKRVLIARALAQGAPIVLLDEPVAFLDVRHQLEVCELLASGVAAGEFSAVAVLHDLNLASQFCDRVALFRDGACVALGAVDDVMTPERIRATFDAELLSGTDARTGARYFVPMRSRPRA